MHGMCVVCIFRLEKGASLDHSMDKLVSDALRNHQVLNLLALLVQKFKY
jgi:hypothetical protein